MTNNRLELLVQSLKGDCLLYKVIVTVINASYARYDMAKNSFGDIGSHSSSDHESSGGPPNVVKPPALHAADFI